MIQISCIRLNVLIKEEHTMKRIMTLVLVLVMSLAVCSFASAEDALKIGYSLKTITNDDFQLALYNAVEAACVEAGYEFVPAIAETQTGVATQVNQIEDLINSGVDALILNPMDSNACIAVMEKAKEQNIPVVLIDQGIEAGHEDLYVTFISTDNYAAAKVAGENMAELLGGEGKVIIVRGANGSSAGDDRADGFKAGIEGTGLVLANEQPGDWTVDVAMQATENMLQADPDIKGIFCCSDNMIAGILQALENNDIDVADICFISFDGAKSGVDYIAAGQLTGSMAQFPSVIGAKAVEVLDAVLKGEKTAADFESFTDAGTTMYSAEDLDGAYSTAF